MVRYFLSLSLTAALLCSCNMVSSLVHDEAVAARVGKHKLYATEVHKIIPDGVSSIDSTNLAMQYINSWATEMLFEDAALRELEKDAQDVSQELEAYRRSLLRFRYEQLFVSDRLDTVVTERQKLDFYNSHKALFKLERPIMKVRYICIARNAPRKDYLIRKMASDKPSDVLEVDSLAFSSAVSYFDRSEEWMDASALASEFGLTVSQMMKKYSKPYIKDDAPSDPNVKVAYVRDMVQSGTAPLDFCGDRIRDCILSARKHELLSGLEHDLLQQAMDKGNFVIY